MVNIKTANTSDEMVALMNEGGFDLVTASGDASLRLIAGGRVQPVNVDLIPSWSTVDDRLKEAPWYVVDGVHCALRIESEMPRQAPGLDERRHVRGPLAGRSGWCSQQLA